MESSFTDLMMTHNNHDEGGLNAVDNDLIMEDSLMGDDLDWLKFDV
jgi:hypothetical protein